jgi:hypothetical protein
MVKHLIQSEKGKRKKEKQKKKEEKQNRYGMDESFDGTFFFF